jgi:SAP domain-containing ribonucleoprotein
MPGRSKDELQSLTVAKLKEELKAADLPVTGNKPELVQRLFENEQQGEAQTDADAAGGGETAAAANSDAAGQGTEAIADVSAPDAAQTEAAAATDDGKPPGRAIVWKDTKELAADAAAQPNGAGDAAAAGDGTKPKPSEQLSAEDRKKSRELRFGAAQESATDKQHKLGERAKRFGTTAPAAAANGAGPGSKRIAAAAGLSQDPEKVKARKDRFGTASHDDKVAKRQERFGLANPASDDKVAKRKERFGPEEGSAAQKPGSSSADPAWKAKVEERKQRFAGAS